MKVGNQNLVRGTAGAVLFAILSFIVLVQYAPDAVAFSPNNYGWNGLHDIASTYNVNFTTSSSSLPAGAIMAILQPSLNFSSSDSNSVRGFLLTGGTVLVADKSGVANSLLRGIGSAISVESKNLISDTVFNWKARSVPTALVLPDAKSSFEFLAGVNGIALNQPSPLLLTSTDAQTLAVTSQFSTTQAGMKGPFTVMAAQKIGKGTLIVLGDSQFLLNSEWTVADNKALVGKLFANKGVYIDASHWTVSPLTSSTSQVKAQLRQDFDTVSASPEKYAFVLGAVLLALIMVPTSDVRQADLVRLLERIRRSVTTFNDRTSGDER